MSTGPMQVFGKSKQGLWVVFFQVKGPKHIFCYLSFLSSNLIHLGSSPSPQSLQKRNKWVVVVDGSNTSVSISAISFGIGFTLHKLHTKRKGLPVSTTPRNSCPPQIHRITQAFKTLAKSTTPCPSFASLF